MATYKPPKWYMQVINIGRNELNLDDDQYRCILVDLTSKNSLRKMTIPELFKVLEHFKKCGFKPKASNNASKKKNSPTSSNKPKSEKTMLDKLRQIWIEMSHQGFLNDGSEQALFTWASNQVKRMNKGKAVARLEWFTDEMLYFSIEQLKMWHLRVLKKSVDSLQIKVTTLTLEPLDKENVQLAMICLQQSQAHDSYNNAFNVFSELLNRNTEAK